MPKYSIYNILENINPFFNRIPSKKKLDQIQERFCHDFLHNFECRINSKALKTYRSVYDKIFNMIFEEEIKGILSDDQRITTDYYKQFNAEIAFALHDRLDQKTYRYGGYSIEQIVDKITNKAKDLSWSEQTYSSTNSIYRIVPLAERICHTIEETFSEYRDQARKEFISANGNYSFSSLSPKENYDSSDPILKLNAQAQQIFHAPIKKYAKYMSFPVVKGSYISSESQKYNLDAYTACIAKGYEQAAGYAVLTIAGTGVGKTEAFIKTTSAKLGELCNCEVYIVMPYRNQVEQARSSYHCDVKYSEGEITGKGYDPNVRVYIYDYAKDIPTTTTDPITGAGRPSILIIDEAHSLLTETYRAKALRDVENKARDILSAGGVVIAMSASGEMIAPTMPYNTIAGYDLICNIFRVSSNKDLTDTLKYPYYTYGDIIKHGKSAGVEIVNAIPAENIRVIYKNPHDKIASALISLIIKEITKGKKVIIEYNNINIINACKRKLYDLGYKAAVCSSDDKDYKYDNNTKKTTYYNRVLNDIINYCCVDWSFLDVVLTTRFLENGTSIASIKGDVNEADITTIFVAEKKDRLDFEAFEQFSGRVRFEHSDAILFMICPDEADYKTWQDPTNYLRKKMADTITLSDKIKNGELTMERLEYIDFLSKEDNPGGLTPAGSIDARTMSHNVYKAFKQYYMQLMGDRKLFEKKISERYPTKKVTFEYAEPANVEICSTKSCLSHEEAKSISDSINLIYNDNEMRDAIICDKGVFKERSINDSVPLFKEMKELSRRNYIEPLKATLSINLALQNINDKVSKLHNTDILEGLPKEPFVSAAMSDNISKVITSALCEKSNRAINTLMSNSISDGFMYLEQYNGLSDTIKTYALRYGPKDYDIEELISDCVKLLPKMPTDLKNDIISLMRTLFISKKKQKIDKLIFAHKLNNRVDLHFYAYMAEKNDSEIDQIMQLYEYYSFALDPSSIHAGDTRSGATFAAVTGLEAYLAITDNNDDQDYKGLESFCNKKITKKRVEKVYEIYKKNMSQKKYDYDRNPTSGCRKILRLYTFVFTFERGESDKDGGYIILRDIRKRLPKKSDMEKILHLTFGHKKKH